MKKLVWGTRTMARKFGVDRDVVRNMIDRRELDPSMLKKNNCMYFVFAEKDQNKLAKLLNEKKKNATKRSSSF